MKKAASRGARLWHARTRELGQIHMGAKDLGLIRTGDDSAYRDMLYTIARVRSAADLDSEGRRRVIEHMLSKGWSPFKKPEPSQRYQRGTQAALIRHLWTELHNAGLVRDKSDKALRSWCKTHSPGNVEAPQMLPRAAAHEVIERLKQWLARGDASDAAG